MQNRQALALALISVSACTFEAKGEHLHVVGSSVNSSEEEIQELVDVGEALHADIAALHPDIALDDEIRVELHGKFRQTSPYVDDEGTVHLWRFSEAEGGYRAMYAHELVHEAYPDADAEAEAYLGKMGWYEPCLE